MSKQEEFYESAQAKLNDNAEFYDGVYKSGFATASRTYKDIEANRSVRPGFHRSDYEAFRPDSAVPTDKRQAIRLCMKAYKEVGVIRNVIDLMGDFACQGVDLVHRDKSAESFFKQWFRKINGKERSERFLNNLYRAGNVVCYRSYADVTPKLREYMRSIASDVKIDIPEAKKNRVPFRYNFFNPLSLDLKNNGKLHINITNQPRLLDDNNIHHGPFQTSNVPNQVFETLPAILRTQISQNKKQIELEENRLLLAHYKKDDWEQWADPLISAILDDIMMLQKMRLADLSALDGAISNIRLWTLGDLEHKIIPDKNAINRLRDVLATNQGGGTMELVWGPELDFKESATEVHKFLGSEKYNSVLNAIYAGLGVPPTLTGMAGNAGGFTNNFISLKTLVERLQYGRDLLIRFWQKEVELVRQAMGFRHVPEVVFDQMSLSDEAAEKSLLIQLADRDIISNETILERFKEVPKVEKVRLQRENIDRDNNTLPEKTSPYHNPEHHKDMEKINRQGEIQMERIEKSVKNKGMDQIGRPKNTRDTTKRKRRTETPRSTPGRAFVWADEALERISSVVTKAFLGHNNKTNLRQLTKTQTQQVEEIKVEVLACVDPLEDFGDYEIYHALKSNNPNKDKFKKALVERGITLPRMSVEAFRKHVVGTYVELLDCSKNT